MTVDELIEKHADRWVRITNRERFLIVRALSMLEDACETMGHETVELRKMKSVFCEENWMPEYPICHGGKVQEVKEMINLNNVPVEPAVTILNPDGSELITTNNVTTFTYIRFEIRKNKLSGYKVRDERGNVYDICHDGHIFDEGRRWPDNLTGKIYDNLLVMFLSIH